jgi:flagellar basal body rod protein FlgG
MDAMQWMSSAMRAARAQLDTATLNLANASSGAFRKLTFDARLGSRGIDVRTDASVTQGALRQTGRSLDLAISGPGTFDLGTARTRDGAFVRDREGYLADRAGHRVRGTAGPILVGPDTAFGSDGTVRERGRTVNRIALAPGSTLHAGFLEGSNVDAIGEMLAVVSAERAFETAQKTLSAVDSIREKAVSDVGRLK